MNWVTFSVGAVRWGRGKLGVSPDDCFYQLLGTRVANWVTCSVGAVRWGAGYLSPDVCFS